MTHDIVTDKD